MSSLENLIRTFSEKNVLVIGDVMLDRFIWGSVSRISPEAPVPVVNVEKEAVYPGGAANVARNLVPFAAGVHMVGQVGEDRDGDILATILESGGIEAAGLIRAADYDTITKTRIIARKQQVARVDREKILPISRHLVERVKQFVVDRIDDLDAIIISDYGKGFITQELADAVTSVARSRQLVITVDPNPNNPLNWQGVTSVKPNRAEAFREAGIPETLSTSEPDPLRDEVLLRVGENLLEKWGTEMVQITLGEQGMILFERGGEPHHIPTVAREVFDVSGAGDTAIALFTLSLAAGASPLHAAEISNYASGVVVGKLGTATLNADELLQSMKNSPVQARLEAMADKNLVI